MKLGVRAHDYGRHSAAKLAEMIAAEGFEAVQLAVPKAIEGIESYETMTESDACVIYEAFAKKQIDISVLGCYIDISCMNSELRLEHLRRFERALCWGKELQAGMVGTESSFGIVSMEDKKKTFGLVKDGVARIVEQAEACGVNVGIEPVAAHALYSAEWTRELLDFIDSSRLKVIFDPVNLLTLETIENQETLWDACFAAFGKDIGAVHLKDFTVEKNGRFAPCLLGEGLMKYDRIFEWLHRENSSISILREEIVPRTAGQDIKFMKNILDRQ